MLRQLVSVYFVLEGDKMLTSLIVANVAQGKPAALPTVTKVAPTTSSTSQKAASVTPSTCSQLF